MSQKIKNFWLKIGTMFLTLYFMPLADFIMGIFGASNSGNANAGTVYCTSTAISASCDGVSTKTLQFDQTVQCTCSTNSSQVYDLTCTDEWDERNNGWRAVFTRGSCYTAGACSPNGKTEDCSTSTRYGTKKCVNGKWGACEYGECKSGYILTVYNSCASVCNIENGTGYKNDIASSSSTEA